MKDRPTFREFLFYYRKAFVKSTSGGFYTPVNSRKAKALYFVVFLAFEVMLFTVWILTMHRGQLWPTRMIDFLLLLNLGNLLCQYPHYRFTRYERIPEDSEAYARASTLKYPSKATVISMSLLAAILLLVALQSTGASYVRYWLDGGAMITQADISIGGHDKPLPLAQEALSGDAPMLQIPAASGSPSVSVSVTTSGSPEPLQLMLDGKAARVFADQELRWFWDANYFVQCGYIDDADVHDGSVLTLTCGELTREWVFEVADEEAS